MSYTITSAKYDSDTGLITVTGTSTEQTGEVSIVVRDGEANAIYLATAPVVDGEFTAVSTGTFEIASVMGYTVSVADYLDPTATETVTVPLGSNQVVEETTETVDPTAGSPETGVHSGEVDNAISATTIYVVAGVVAFVIATLAIIHKRTRKIRRMK